MYMFKTTLTSLPHRPSLFNFAKSNILFMQSKALLKSIKHIYRGTPRALCFSIMPFNMNKLSLVLLPFLKPPLKGSLRLKALSTNSNLLFIIVSKIFEIAGRTDIRLNFSTDGGEGTFGTGLMTPILQHSG